MTMIDATLRLLRLASTRPLAQPSSSAPSDPERARQYNRTKERVFIAGMLLSWLVSAVMLMLRIGPRIHERNRRLAPPDLVRDSATVLALGALSTLATMPLRYFGGYMLEHRYDLSNHTHRTWAIDQLKATLLQTVLGLPVLHGLYWTIRRAPRHWWIIVSGLSIPLTIVLAQLFPVLIAPLFNRYEPLRNQELADRLKRLAGRSGIEVADVLQMDMSRQTKKANAFFTGIGSTKRIVLADTLLNEFTDEEIEVIVAHEIAHQANRDIWRLIAVGTVSTLALSWGIHRMAMIATERLSHLTGIRDIGQVSSLPLLGLIGSVLGTLVGPLQNAYSRYIERQADQYALELTNDPGSFESAMRRLAGLNLAELDPPWLTRTLLHSHPSIRERIEQAQRYRAR
jgi:STE24 endopeptidase